MSYLGLTPSEDTSGEKRRQGAITKTGEAVRRRLVEAAWHYHRAPLAKGQTLVAAARTDSPLTSSKISWQAQRRLHRICWALDLITAANATSIVAVAFVARELMHELLLGTRQRRLTPSPCTPSAEEARHLVPRESISDLSMSNPGATLDL